MYIRMYVSMYVYIARTHTIRMYVYTYVRKYVCIYVVCPNQIRMHIRMNVCMHIRIYFLSLSLSLSLSVGLCSYEDPVKALREMARVCKTEQQGGRLLLLEHGRSWLWPVNVLLDRSVVTKLYIYHFYHIIILYLSNSFILFLFVAVYVLLDRSEIINHYHTRLTFSFSLSGGATRCQVGVLVEQGHAGSDGRCGAQGPRAPLPPPWHHSRRRRCCSSRRLVLQRNTFPDWLALHLVL